MPGDPGAVGFAFDGAREFHGRDSHPRWPYGSTLAKATLANSNQTPGMAFFKGRSNSNSTTAMAKDRPLNSSQKLECSHSVHNTPMTVSLLPMAVATNQPPIMMPRCRVGDTLATSARPMGDSINSASVSTA